MKALLPPLQEESANANFVALSECCKRMDFVEHDADVVSSDWELLWSVMREAAELVVHNFSAC